MINSILINNFQSHKKSSIAFCDGVNVIQGVSDSGKSAIIRAILFVIINRPIGTDQIVSHFAIDKKNKIIDELSVKISTDKGTVIRRRTSNDNEYILKLPGHNDNYFKAVNKCVPDEINNFFNIIDLNVQMQHDPPFLLSQSSGDVMAYINKIVRLDVIDTVLGNTESARRETNKKIKETDCEKKELEKKLEDYDWIGQAQKLAVALDNQIKRCQNYFNDLLDKDLEIKQYENAKKELKSFPDIKKANILIEKIENIKIDYDLRDELEINIEKYKKVNRDRKIFEMVQSGKETITDIEKLENNILKVRDEHSSLKNEIEEYTDNKKLAATNFDKKKASEIISEIENIEVQNEYNNLSTLNSEITAYNRLKDDIKKLNEAVIDYKEQLPKSCPLCGNTLEKST